jgi:hypothetical protein
MVHRALPAALALAAFSADLGGAHRLALAALLLAIPAAFGLALDRYADLIEAGSGGWRPLLDGTALVLLLLSAALRSPAVVGGVPRLAVSSIVAALLAYAAVAVGSAAAPGRAQSADSEHAGEEERVAA